ncbi:MAG: V-type ATPase subunit [Lachnospiraceae bacterium]
MPSVLAYSAITTKIKAMNKKLFNQEDYDQLMTRSSVGDALSFLKRKESYEILFRDFNKLTPRVTLKALLTYSSTMISLNYIVCKFKSNENLWLYFMKYEIDILKDV